MDLDQESKAGIGIDVNLRYVLAIRIELESMPATVFAEQPRVERSADVVNAGVRLLPYRPADQIAEPLVSPFCQGVPTSCILVLPSKPLCIRREPRGLRFNLLAPPDMVVNSEVLYTNYSISAFDCDENIGSVKWAGVARQSGDVPSRFSAFCPRDLQRLLINRKLCLSLVFLMAHKRYLAHPAHHLEQVLVRRHVVVAHVAGAHLVEELLGAGDLGVLHA